MHPIGRRLCIFVDHTDSFKNADEMPISIYSKLLAVTIKINTRINSKLNFAIFKTTLSLLCSKIFVIFFRFNYPNRTSSIRAIALLMSYVQLTKQINTYFKDKINWNKKKRIINKNKIIGIRKENVKNIKWNSEKKNLSTSSFKHNSQVRYRRDEEEEKMLSHFCVHSFADC